MRSRRLLTVFGEVKITRVGHGAPGLTIYPLDGELELPQRTYSYECQGRLLKAVICSPFDEAIGLL
jgi:hypothetical protein